MPSRHIRSSEGSRFTVCGCEIASNKVKVEMLPYTPAADCPHCLQGKLNPRSLKARFNLSTEK